MGARQRGIPAVCMVDLFAIDEVEWLRASDYADHVCVLNESVRQFLIDSGRTPAQVSVTGHPAFDALNAPMEREAGLRMRAQHGWRDRRVVLWPTQVEPAFRTSRSGGAGRLSHRPAMVLAMSCPSS